MIKRYHLFVAALSSVILFLSCSSPQDVLNDYNTHFEKVAAATHHILETGNAAAMLQELYKVDIEHTRVLTAPVGCESYEWEITDVGGKNRYETRLGRQLNIYIPDTPLHKAALKADGKSRLYDVTLTVKYKGKVYSDTAVLVLYVAD